MMIGADITRYVKVGTLDYWARVLMAWHEVAKCLLIDLPNNLARGTLIFYCLLEPFLESCFIVYKAAYRMQIPRSFGLPNLQILDY